MSYNSATATAPIEPIVLSDKPAPAAFMSPITLDKPEYGIRIVCLPRGYETYEAVYDLVKNTLALGEPECITIQNRVCNNPIQPEFYTAMIYFVNVYKTNTAELITKTLSTTPFQTTLKIIPSYTEFYWYNGKKMTHLSIQKIKPQVIFQEPPVNITMPSSGETQILQLDESDWTGLHIPIITNDICLDGNAFQPTDFEDLIENKLKIGKVHRIDYVERDDVVKTAYGKIEHINKGDVVPNSTPVTAIFVHMKYWYDTTATHMIRNTLNQSGQYYLKGYWDNEIQNVHAFTNKNNSFKNPYFVLKINHRPIPDADGKLNIHQLTAIKTKLEKEIEELKTISKKAVEDLYVLLEEVVEENRMLKSKSEVVSV